MGRRRELELDSSATTAPSRRPRTAAELAQQMPAPYAALNDSPNLVDTERADLELCETAIDALRLAFWAAGKALQIIRDGRLYRGTHTSFDAYCLERWQMTRQQADRLIRAWPVAEALAAAPLDTPTLNESQVRPLIPLADRYGQDAAILVYGVVSQVQPRVTATALQDAVTAVVEEFDPQTAAEQIRAYLERESDEQPQDADPWQAHAQRLRSSVTRTVRTPAFRELARSRPQEARAVVTEVLEELRGVLQELEQPAD
jgi:hypothetical protein